MVQSVGWLERCYRTGQSDDVWHELRQLGSRVREPGFAGEVQLVCDETDRRARHNIEVIVGRLSGTGYRFHSNDDAQTPEVPYVPPAAAAGAHADGLEDLFGLWNSPAPTSRRCWTAAAGSVGWPGGPGPTGVPPSLRWILCHMTEEYADRNGHASLLRESIDGAAGE